MCKPCKQKNLFWSHYEDEGMVAGEEKLGGELEFDS